MAMHGHESGRQTKYQECYVAFLDILGFKELVRRSQRDGGVLSALVRALDTTANLSPTTHERRDVQYEGGRCVGVSNQRRWVTQIRAFSDSVALFVPTETDGLSSLLCQVRYLHDRLLELECCMRGAVTMGEMYWDDAWCQEAAPGQTESDESQTKILYDRDALSNGLVTFGPALVEAYELETTVAVYPRAVFSPGLLAHVQRMAAEKPKRQTDSIHRAAHAGFICAPTPENHCRSILDFIRTDSDGVAFLDLFHRDIARDDTQRIVRENLADGQTCTHWIGDGMTFEEFMRRTRETIARFLADNQPPRIRAKHLWLANYFNEALAGLDVPPIPIVWAQLPTGSP